MNNNSYDLLRMVETAQFNKPKPTAEDLRALIHNLANVVAPGLSESELEAVAREFESRQGISAGLGAILDSEDFEPWLDDAKSDIKPYYWDRYSKYLVQCGIPKSVVIDTDRITDQILGRLGNPELKMQWDRRGLVVGHVQSGKTSNYIGLICKAADAGYRLIIVIAGMQNNLRSQTQSRIDEGFIGRDTGKVQMRIGVASNKIGVGFFGSDRTPVCLTNTLKDFNKETASTNTSEIDSYIVPVVLVIKKNTHTLTNLLEWLRDNSARGDKEMIDQPMLLIDDEADNASINTKYAKESVTRINGQIRDLLNLFQRSCYVGYTATPFANIFIDPDQDDEMYNEDLFPRNFIMGLGAPSNYFGPTEVMLDGLPEDGEPKWVRYITDNEDLLPIKHKIDHELIALPQSMASALRTFLLSRTIRNLRGHESDHCSMLVNASRFTLVHGQLRNCLHELLEQIKNAVRINASMGQSALRDPEIAKLHAVWKNEYAAAGEDWADIQKELHNAIASAKVVEVNSQANDLDYSTKGKHGQTVIAVGGFSLSRGLTLEGLTVTWFLRNTLMYDTLMQMGRWFGYREGYKDLCRIWMPTEAIEWYAFIANAVEELHDELRDMEAAKATPDLFGLAVRRHPATLLVTARNKMGSGKKVITRVGLSNKFVETSRVSIKPDNLNANISAARLLISKLKQKIFEQEISSWGTIFRNVPVHVIDDFLAGWHNAEQSVTTETRPIRNYISSRKENELKFWDVLIASLKTGQPYSTLGMQIVPTRRYVNLKELKHGFMSFSGQRMRLSSRGIEKAGVDPLKAKKAEDTYRKDNNKFSGNVNYPDSIYRKERDRGLFILHFVKATKPKESEGEAGALLLPPEPAVAWGISLPRSSGPVEHVEYLVNTIRYRELFGEEEEDDEQIRDNDVN